MESSSCVYCGSKISKRALLCPDCRSIGFIARGNTPAKRNIGIGLTMAGIAAALLLQLEAGTFADKAVSFGEGFFVGLGMVIAFAIPKRK